MDTDYLGKAEPMIQDILPHVLDNRFTDNITPQDEDIVLHFE